MIAYVDSSVVLRIVLGQPGALTNWRAMRTAISSRLAEVECLQALDRLRLRSAVKDEEIALRREAVVGFLNAIEMIEVSYPILARASQPLPTELGTLDSIHLATALLWREMNQRDLVMATHDQALGLAARACGLRVVGLSETGV
jgi:predicted nucleic acid-binding protein